MATIPSMRGRGNEATRGLCRQVLGLAWQVVQMVNAMTSIADFRAFFDRCRQREHEHADRSTMAGFCDFFQRVGPKLDELLEAARREEALEEAQFAPYFNVFRALEIERKEEILHTRMLAHLLSPSGRHGQGLLFLKSFFDAAIEHPEFIPPDGPIEEAHWLVQKEFYIAGVGELDLLIENARKRYIIVIENKIGGNDQVGQLCKYRKWMDDARADYDSRQRQLIYLTPNGRPPISNKGCKCLQFSYSEHIRGFLDAALKEVQAAPVKEIVRQYLAVVNALTEERDEQAD